MVAESKDYLVPLFGTRSEFLSTKDQILGFRNKKCVVLISRITQIHAINLKGEKEDTEVPMNATIVSTTFFLVSLLIWNFLNFSNEFWILLCLSSAYYILPLPILLIFTIKQKKDHVVTVQPPQTLQFHNEEVLSEDFSNHNSYSHQEIPALNYQNFYPDFGENSIVCLNEPLDSNYIRNCDSNPLKASLSKGEDAIQRNVIVHYGKSSQAFQENFIMKDTALKKQLIQLDVTELVKKYEKIPNFDKKTTPTHGIGK